MPFLLNAQVTTSWREKTLTVKGDSAVLDSLSIDPTSFSIRHNGNLLDTSIFLLQPGKALLILDKSAPHDSLKIRYAVFPVNFSRIVAHKDSARFIVNPENRYNPFVYSPGKAKTEDPFAMGGLNKNGNLSRGISFGNNRDLSVNSNLNLQISGKLTDNVDLLMAATDDNLPIQPDGTTQQLQQFDRVFIQLSSPKGKMIAGDFFTQKPTSYFMNFNKRGQGINVSGSFPVQYGSDTAKKAVMSISASGAVSKGKFARNVIQGSEGNQGPYRLRGDENELFIIILAGTEKVYIDGKLMIRGQENDYIIDYNTAEITFTAKQLITKDKRIVVEFQYSDRNYARSMFHTGVEWKTKKQTFRLNGYTEQDNKNQPLQQALTDSDKLRMAAVGDTLSLAYVDGADSVAFSGDVVLYKKIDTLVNTVIYNDVYVYSIDPDSAHYRCSFSFVGPNKGNYIQVSASANGKVYRWVAPVNNIPQGQYEPIVLLITPKKRQMVTLGHELKIGKKGLLRTEGAVSNYDQNTFSPYNNDDNEGYGAFVNYQQEMKLKDSLQLTPEISYEYISSHFTPIERYRSAEFERDWNLGWGQTQKTLMTDQHLVAAGITLKRLRRGAAGYQFSTFQGGSSYSGIKHSVNGNYNHKSTRAAARASYLTSDGTFGNTKFIRNRAELTQQLGKKLSIGGWQEYEHSLARRYNSDTLQASSFAYLEWESFLQIGDSSKRSVRFFYRQRLDDLPSATALLSATKGESTGATLTLNTNPNSRLRLTGAWRRLYITNSSITTQQPDNTVIGRLEYSLRAWKGLVSWTTFYEAGSGLEARREFSYIEVPTGQGTYSWTDYNNNGVKELNEFEVAVFSDQAKYIRVYTPTNEYVRVFTNQLSQSFTIRPAVAWANRKGLRGVVARFSDQAVYRVDRKTMSADVYDAYAPVLSNTGDSALVALNATVRNTVFFNQLSSKFGAEYTWQELRGKNLLTNGLESRGNTFHEFRLRWNLTKALSFTTEFRDGVKSNYSEYFAARNYRIIYRETEPRFSIQPGTTFRVSVLYRYSEKQNSAEFGNENAQLQKFGSEIKISRLSKGSMTGEVNYIRIAYNGNVSSAVGYDMLEGLKPGQNFTWRLNWQRALAQNLQLTLGYEGRKTPGNFAIHTGSAQVRAMF
ncbi:MAG: hypothetical protein Fur0041_03480 [Bacteroidia bacterium]